MHTFYYNYQYLYYRIMDNISNGQKSPTAKKSVTETENIESMLGNLNDISDILPEDPLNQIKILQAENVELKKQIQMKDKQLDIQKKTNKTIQTLNNGQKARIKELEQKLKTLEKSKIEGETEDRERNQRETFERRDQTGQQIKLLRDSNAVLLEDKLALKRQIEKFKISQQSHERAMNQIKEENQSLNNRIRSLQAELESNKSSSYHQSSEVENLEQRIKQLEAEIKIKSKNEEENLTKISKLEKSKANTDSEMGSKKEVQKLQKKNSQLSKEIQLVTKDKLAYQLRLTEVQKKIKELENTLAETRKSRDAFKSKSQSLQERLAKANAAKQIDAEKQEELIKDVINVQAEIESEDDQFSVRPSSKHLKILNSIRQYLQDIPQQSEQRDFLNIIFAQVENKLDIMDEKWDDDKDDQK